MKILTDFRGSSSGRYNEKRDTHGCGCLFFGRDDRIRTCGLFVPNEARYQTALHLDILSLCSLFRLQERWVGGYPACGARNALARRWLRRISTATPFRTPCIRHRRRSCAKPERSALPNCATSRYVVVKDWCNAEQRTNAELGENGNAILVGAATKVGARRNKGPPHCATSRYVVVSVKAYLL